jgi:ankyrin repeat protein
MSFWKKLLGAKEPPKTGLAETKSTLRSAAVDPRLPLILPIPAELQKPAQPLSQSVSGHEKSASFHAAVKSGDLELVKALLKEQADLVFTRDSSFGGTPLYWAAVNGHKGVAELLLANKAEVNAKDNLGWTPLHSAAVTGRKVVTELLLANQADVNARDNNGATPLNGAVSNGHEDVAALLLANQAEVNAKDNNGRMPLHLAVDKGHKGLT